MEMKTVRKVHLYLGVFFAPLLIFFIVSGCLQTFRLHSDQKSGYKAPVIAKYLGEIHQHQNWAPYYNKQSSVSFRYLVLLMGVGLIATTLLGIVMAFKFTRPWIVWLSLFLGTAIPVLLLWLR